MCDILIPHQRIEPFQRFQQGNCLSIVVALAHGQNDSINLYVVFCEFIKLNLFVISPSVYIRCCVSHKSTISFFLRNIKTQSNFVGCIWNKESITLYIVSSKENVCTWLWQVLHNRKTFSVFFSAVGFMNRTIIYTCRKTI